MTRSTTSPSATASRSVGAVIPSQSTQAQPSAGEVAKLAAVVRREQVKAVFPESSINPELAQTLARETGAKADYVLYGDTPRPGRLERRHIPEDGGGKRRRDGEGIHRGCARMLDQRPLIETEGLAVAYRGGPVVLEDVTLSVERGRRVGVLGPNGGGKTTLMRALLGELSPRRGTLTVRGRCGTVPQTERSRLDYPVSALDVVLMGALGRGPWWRRPGRADRVAALDALERVDLGRYARETFGELSGGQRQRVLVARALLQDADIVLFDEPFTGLDAPSAAGLTALIDTLAAEGRAVLVATHDVAQTLAWDAVLCLNRRQVGARAAGRGADRGHAARDVRARARAASVQRCDVRGRRASAWLTPLLEPWREPILREALIEMVLVGFACGALGVWIVLYGLSYGAESLAHAMFPGLAVAALLGVPLVLGGAVGLALAGLAVALAARIRGVGADNAVAVVVTSLFGLGALLALSPDSPPGLQGLLFGDVLATNATDLALAGALAAAVLCGMWLVHWRLLAVGFDPSSARGLGITPVGVELALSVLLAGAVLVGVQGLGNLLVVAALIGPAAAARALTRRVAPMIAVAASLGAIAGVGGLYISYYLEVAAGAAIASVLVIAPCLAIMMRSGLFLVRSRRTPDRSPWRSPASS